MCSCMLASNFPSHLHFMKRWPLQMHLSNLITTASQCMSTRKVKFHKSDILFFFIFHLSVAWKVIFATKRHHLWKLWRILSQTEHESVVDVKKKKAAYTVFSENEWSTAGSQNNYSVHTVKGGRVKYWSLKSAERLLMKEQNLGPDDLRASGLLPGAVPPTNCQPGPDITPLRTGMSATSLAVLSYRSHDVWAACSTHQFLP